MSRTGIGGCRLPGMAAGAPRRNAVVLLVYLFGIALAVSYLLGLF
ncbi:hypothetical protein [Halorientalis regularis]|nr:hypothetical protein [Halorientalis regularis]